MKHLLLAGAVLGLAGCAVPDDQLFTAEVPGRVEVFPGVFQLTFNAGPDLVRGFTHDGRVLIRRQVPEDTTTWRIVSVPAEGGPLREEAGLYRAALTAPVGALVSRNTERLLTVLSHPPILTFSCSCLSPSEFPTVTGVTMFWLESEDGQALSRLPTHPLSLRAQVRFDSVDAVDGTIVFGDTIRLANVQQSSRELSANPFGPAVSRDGSTAYVSDGEVVWRVERAAPGERDSVGAGAFPALSPDGRSLAASIPLGLDSTIDFCVLPLPDNVECHQRLFRHSSTGRGIVIYDLATGDRSDAGPGTEVLFDPVGDGLIVRRTDGIYRVARDGTGSLLVPGTEGGYAIAVSPDGGALAFTVDRGGNPNAFITVLEP